MRKTPLSLVVVLVVVSVAYSCRKSVLPSIGPDPEPPVDTVSTVPPVDTTPVVEPKIVETEPAILKPVTDSIAPTIKGYYEALPVHYEESKSPYPLILFFHGGGQYGDGSTADLQKTLTEGIPKLLRDKIFPPSFGVGKDTFSFVVLAPQLVKRAGPLDIHAFVQYALKKYKVDSSRVYVAGLSLGSRYMSDYAAAYPYEVAAMVAMAGAPAIDGALHEKCHNMMDARLPIWQAHCRPDSAWPYHEIVDYIADLNSFIPTLAPRLTTFEVGAARLSHDCWTRMTNPAYREEGKNIYEWMLGYKR